MSLYADYHPETSIKGFGYGNKQKALDTLKKFYADVRSRKRPSEFLINTFGSILVRVYGKKFVPVLRLLGDLKISNKEMVSKLL